MDEKTMNEWARTAQLLMMGGFILSAAGTLIGFWIQNERYMKEHPIK